MGVKINDLPVVRWGVNKNMVGEDGYPQDAFCYYCGLNLHTECVENVKGGYVIVAWVRFMSVINCLRNFLLNEWSEGVDCFVDCPLREGSLSGVALDGKETMLCSWFELFPYHIMCCVIT